MNFHKSKIAISEQSLVQHCSACKKVPNDQRIYLQILTDFDGYQYVLNFIHLFLPVFEVKTEFWRYFS